MIRQALLAGIAVAALPAVAAAQPAPTSPPPPPPDYYRPPPPEPQPPVAPEPESEFRHGTWFVGVGLGAASIDYEDGDESYGAFMLDGHLGGMVGERLGLLVWFTGDSHDVDEFDELRASMVTLGGGLRYWATPRVWIGGGLGTSQWTLREYGDVSDSYKGRTLLANAAYEVWRQPKMALDVEARLMATTLDVYGEGAGRTAFGLLVNLTWY